MYKTRLILYWLSIDREVWGIIQPIAIKCNKNVITLYVCKG